MDRFLLFPLLVPLVPLVIGSDAFGFDAPGWLDPWVYVGYFWHYPEHLWVFDDNSNYKISRLPWILPGFVAHTLLGPIAGTYVLAYFSLALGALGLYLFVRDALGDRFAAAVVCIAWSGCTWAHGIGGWNYHMLATAGYYLLGCWLVVRAARASQPALWATMAGVCIAAAVHTHLFLVVFIPLVALLFWASLPATVENWSRHARRAGSFALLGTLGLTLVLAVINRVTGGTWLFFMPQFEQALKLTEPAYDHWWQGNVDRWLPTASYLVIPFAFMVAGLAVPFRRRGNENGRTALTLVALAWAALAIMCFFQFVRRQTTLDYSYMAFAIYLHAFPCMGAVLSGARRDDRSPAVIAAVIAAIVLGALLLLPTPLPRGMTMFSTALGLRSFAPIVAPLVVCLAGVAAMTWLPRPARAVVFAVWFSLVNAWIAPMPSAYGMGTPGYRHQMMSMFREADRFTTALDPTLIGIKYWMSNEEIASPHGTIQMRLVFDSFVATRAWFTNLLGRVAPSPPVEQLTIEDLERGTCIGVLSSVERQAALQESIATRFAGLGRPLRNVADARFEGADFSFALTVLKPISAVPVSTDTGGEREPCRQPEARN